MERRKWVYNTEGISSRAEMGRWDRGHSRRRSQSAKRRYVSSAACKLVAMQWGPGGGGRGIWRKSAGRQEQVVRSAPQNQSRQAFGLFAKYMRLVLILDAGQLPRNAPYERVSLEFQQRQRWALVALPLDAGLPLRLISAQQQLPPV